MISRFTLSLLAALCLSLSTTGCFFWKKGKQAEAKPAKPSYLCSDMEKSLRKRWLEKRVAELTATDKTPEAATAQAEQEFDKQYAYTSASKTPAP